MNEDIEFLKKVFLLDGAEIVKVEGGECGHKYLRVFTQTEEQKDLKIMTVVELRFTETSYPPNRLRQSVGRLLLPRRKK